MEVMQQEAVEMASSAVPAEVELGQLRQAYLRVLEEKQALEMRVRESEERRGALLHVLNDLNTLNRKLADQRKAMIHILADYEQDRRRLIRQTERLDNSRRALLHILQDLHQSNLRLEKSRKAMIHIMGDLKESEETVQARTRELVEANAAKDVFLGMASHELRTPLTILKGLAQILHRRFERAGSAELAPLVRMEQAIHRMELHVNDLLNTSLVETGMFVLHRRPCDLVALCQHLLEEYLAEGEYVFLPEAPAQTMEVEVDVERISQVLFNLLSNARKYSPPGSQIIVKVERRDQDYVVSVQDQGVGIPAEQLPHLFDRFYRVPGVEVRTGSSVGVGLGLYIAQKIVEQHGGRIEVTSHPGEGSTFSIVLAARPLPVAAHLVR
jgi:signal transduction histidine kinase